MARDLVIFIFHVLLIEYWYFSLQLVDKLNTDTEMDDIIQDYNAVSFKTMFLSSHILFNM